MAVLAAVGNLVFMSGSEMVEVVLLANMRTNIRVLARERLCSSRKGTEDGSAATSTTEQ